MTGVRRITVLRIDLSKATTFVVRRTGGVRHVHMVRNRCGGIFGVAILGGAFWFALGRTPERRSDGGLIQHDAAYYTSGDDGGGPTV